MKVNIECKKNQKNTVQVKIENGDLWNGDVTLARVIYPFLRKYKNLYKGKNSMCGYPAAFASNPLKPEGPDNPDQFDEWLLCLDKMMYSFEWISKNKDWDGPEVKSFYKESAVTTKIVLEYTRARAVVSF
jgi:hypothetical protein